jgi:general nucleoside transport system permease protein
MNQGSFRSVPRNVPLAVFAALMAVSSFALPSFTLSRTFSGDGNVLIHPGTLVNFTSFQPNVLPDLSGVTLLTWSTVLALAATAALAWFGSRWVWTTGTAVIGLLIVATGVFVSSIDAVHAPLLEQGIAARRLPFQNFGPSLWAYLSFVAGLTALVSSLGQMGFFPGFFSRLRGAVVPGIAMLLSLVLSGVVILALQPVPGAERGPQGFVGGWIGKVDLLWFSFSTLFGPIMPRFRPALDFAPLWQSLALATPLIFTGLGLAFGFRTGLFNIGAAGQVIVGGILCAAVGIYIPGPWFLIGPLAVAAAALGGGLWGALPGWLKGRFGASEVINTIMLNYIASGLLVFLIGSNQASFFGQTINLPFKAEGGEAKSLEFGSGARLANITDLPLVNAGENQFMLALPLLFLGAVLGWNFSKGDSRRRGVIAAVGGAIGLVIGFLLPRLPVSGGMNTSGLSFAFILALLAAAFVGVFLWRTKWGFELRAVGLSPKAAEYGGVSIARNTVLAMAISGALAGLAATHFTMGGALAEYRLSEKMPAATVGFGGITVALLGFNTPGGVVASSILFGVLGTGGLRLDSALDNVSREIVTVIQALIVLFIATRGFLSGDFLRSLNNDTKPRIPSIASPASGSDLVSSSLAPPSGVSAHRPEKSHDAQPHDASSGQANTKEVK